MRDASYCIVPGKGIGWLISIDQRRWSLIGALVE